MAIDPIRKIERAYGFYAQAEQRLRRLGSGSFAIEIVVTVLLHISIIPLVCLIVAYGGADFIVMAAGTTDGFATMVIVFFIFAWLITILITILIMYDVYNSGLLSQGVDSYALFNLRGKYKTLEFDFGHVDDTDMSYCNYEVYLDDVLVLKIEGKPSALPSHYVLELKNAKQLKIIGSDGYYIPIYAFANRVVY